MLNMLNIEGKVVVGNDVAKKEGKIKKHFFWFI
jgi:hypothetical protein